MTSNQNIEQVISRAVTFATTGLICYTHAPSPCTKTLPVGDSAPPLQILRSSPPCEDSEGDSSPPLQTIVQFAKLPHDSLNEDWHLGTTA